MSWRVANSLLTLRDQIDAAWPDRSRASDGTIGDAAHAASVSDHNPDQFGVVRALDITHDPIHGCDIDQLSDALANSHDERISYIIACRLITGPAYDWAWYDYDGDDPHANHLHLSVVNTSQADSTYPWNIGTFALEITPKGAHSDVKSLIRLKNNPHVFLTDGVIARWVQSESEIGDLRTLNNDGTLSLGFSGNIRVVERPELIGYIIGDVPSGWEDQDACPPNNTILTSDGETIKNAVQQANNDVTLALKHVKAMLNTLLRAEVAAGDVAETTPVE